MAKIEPLRPHFENMQALLARIAEDDQAIGFIGCIIKKDGTMQGVHFGGSRQQMAFASALWLAHCVGDDPSLSGS